MHVLITANHLNNNTREPFLQYSDTGAIVCISCPSGMSCGAGGPTSCTVL